MNHRPYSFSKLETYDCPRRYHKKYIEREKEPEAAPMAFGNRFHEFAARYAQSCSEHKIPADVDLAKESLRHVIREKGHTLSTEQIGELSDVAMKWAERESVPIDAELRTEVQFAVDENGALRDWWAPDVKLRGVMDRLTVYRGAGPERFGTPVVIRDLKTAWAISSENDKRLRAQLNFYARLGFYLFPSLDTIMVEADFVRHGVIRSRVVTREEADRELDLIEARMAAIEDAEEWPAKPGSACGFCGFKKDCPAVTGKQNVGAAITTAEQAIERAQELTAIKARAADLERHLKDWVRGAGPVLSGDMEYTFRTVSQHKYCQPQAVIDLAKKYEIDLAAVDGNRLAALLKRKPEVAEEFAAFRIDTSYSRFSGKKLGEEENGGRSMGE